VASFRRVRRGIGILRSTTIEALICGQGLKPHLHSPLVTGLVAVQDGRMVDSGEGESQIIKPKRSAEQQVADEADRKAFSSGGVEPDDIGKPSRARIPGEPQTPQSGPREA
jgi:hypothetical protein